MHMRKVLILWYWWLLFEHTSFVLKPRDYDHVIILVFRLMLSSYTDSTQINIIIIQICTILQQWFGWQQLRMNEMDSVVFFSRVYTWWFNDWIPWRKFTNIFKVGLAGPRIAKNCDWDCNKSSCEWKCPCPCISHIHMIKDKVCLSEKIILII